MGRRAFLRLALVGAGTAALARPRWATAEPFVDVDGSPSGVAIGHGRAVAVGQDLAGAAAWWSDDAKRWTRAAIAPNALLGDVTAVAGGFVAVGSVEGQPAAWWSRNGAHWEVLGTMPQRGHLVTVASAGRAVLAGGAEQLGESDESTGALLASIDRSGAWGTLSTDGVDDLSHGSITALARHGSGWVLAGTSTGASGLWRSTTSRRWSSTEVPGREPVLWSSLLTIGPELVAVGTTVVGDAVQMVRSRDALTWVAGAVPDLLAELGLDLRGIALSAGGTAIAASATGAVASLLDGVVR